MFLVLELQMREEYPRTPEEPPAKLRRHPCRRLPSGRHRAISWTVLLALVNLATPSQMRAQTKAPTRIGSGVFRRGAGSRRLAEALAGMPGVRGRSPCVCDSRIRA